MVIFHSYIGLPEGMYIVFPEFGRRLFFVFHVSYLSYRLKENMLDGENIVLGYARLCQTKSIDNSTLDNFDRSPWQAAAQLKTGILRCYDDPLTISGLNRSQSSLAVVCYHPRMTSDSGIHRCQKLIMMMSGFMMILSCFYCSLLFDIIKKKTKNYDYMIMTSEQGLI